MKTFMKLMNKTTILALLSGVLIIGRVQAQNEEPKAGKPESASVSTSNPGKTFNIEFPGGNAEALIDLIAKQSGTKPNAIIPERLEKLSLPRFKLQNVSTAQVFEALNMTIDEKGVPQFRWMNEGAKVDPHTVWIFSKVPIRPPSEQSQVWFIGNLLESYPLEDINTAIRAAWEMSGQASTAALKFHKETKLLIARGSEQELKLVQEILKELDLGTMAKKAIEAKKAQ